jgi:hypothetical protein
VKTIRQRRPHFELRADDPSLTATAGLVVVAEAVCALGVVGAIDQQVGPVKRRRRGLGPGQLLVGLAETLLAGGDFLVDCDDQRADPTGSMLRSLPPPPSTTAASLARRFGDAQVAGIERAVGCWWLGRSRCWVPVSGAP